MRSVDLRILCFSMVLLSIVQFGDKSGSRNGVIFTLCLEQFSLIMIERFIGLIFNFMYSSDL